ncbi:MAG: dynamin family protein [Moraxella sp.]|nr:dynamin family protein [Moraxella sp.]
MSIAIHIEHNPFTIETTFLIDGVEPADNTFEHYKNSRLQVWIERLFEGLHNYCNGAKDFDITFKGVEADLLDLQAAKENACAQGMNIQLNYIPCRDSNERLSEVQALMREAERNPIFGEEIAKNQQIQKNFAEADNRDFDVYVAATMSAGKSTFINAMLGCDLLPAANEATTATIATITDNDKYNIGEFTGTRINKTGMVIDEKQSVDLAILQQWNKDEDTKLIELEGNILGIKEREEVRLKITDTPGPNNSQDPEHARVTMQHIRDSERNPLIIYLLNGTQLGVNDDKQVLTEIAEIMQTGGKQSKDRFIFVPNKLDNFDPEKGESIENLLKNIRNYLESNGIQNPQIYPVSANTTRLIRKRAANADSLTRSERGDLNKLEELFTEEPSMDFVQYMPISSTVQQNLAQKNLLQVEYRSGVPAIEAMIDEYIAKYNLPNRVNRGYQALSNAIERTTNAAELAKAVEQYAVDLRQAEEQINLLKTDKSRASRLEEEIKQDLIHRKESFISENIMTIDELEVKIRQHIRGFSGRFSESERVSESHARNIIQELVDVVNMRRNRIINELEALIGDAQKNMRNQLSDIFHNKVQQELKSLKDLPLPLLEGIKHQFEALEQLSGLGLSNQDVNEREETKKVKVGTRTVSTSKWWNPLSWGDTEEKDIYETRSETIREVNLREVWRRQEITIRANFNELIKAATDKLIEDTDILADEFTEFMGKEFIKHIDILMSHLLELANNSKQLQVEKDKAEADLIEINRFKEKLNAVLAL